MTMSVPKENLRVKNVEPRAKFKHPRVAFPQLPQHEFSLMMVAPPGSGKTNLLCWMILKLYRQYFHRIVVCSTTIANDEKWNYLKKQKKMLQRNKKLESILEGTADSKNGNKKWKIVHGSGTVETEEPADKELKLDPDDMFMDIDQIFPILQEQQDTIEYLKDYLREHDRDEDEAKYLADRMLIILDDQAGKFDAGINSPLNNFVIRHRHYSASVIIVTQAYRAVPKTIRTCCNQLILFDIGSLGELRSIYEERGDLLDEKTWLEMYNYAVKSEPYSFLYFNYKFPPGQRFYKRFEKMLVIEQKKSSTTSKEEDGCDNGRTEA